MITILFIFLKNKFKTTTPPSNTQMLSEKMPHLKIGASGRTVDKKKNTHNIKRRISLNKMEYFNSYMLEKK